MTARGKIRDYFNTKDFGCVHEISKHADGKVRDVASVLTNMSKEGRVGRTFQKKPCDASQTKHTVFHKTDKTFLADEWKKKVAKTKIKHKKQKNTPRPRNGTKFIRFENEMLRNQNEFLLKKIMELTK